MKSGKFWLAVLVGGVVLNVLDFVLHGMVLRSYYGGMPELFNPPVNPVYFIMWDFVVVLVFAWVYDRVYASFGGGSKGGATFGLYAGILTCFPIWFLMNIIIKGFTMELAWIWTINGLVYSVILGAVIGTMYKKGEQAMAT